MKKIALLNRTLLPITLLTSGLLSISYAHAQSVDESWHGDISVGGAASSGNTTSQTLNALADASLATTDGKLNVNALLNYGNNSVNGISTRSAQQFLAGARYDHNLNDLTFLFGGGEVETNKIQNIHSRYLVNGGIGFKIVHTKDAVWSVFSGIGYSGTKFSEVTPPDPDSQNGVELLIGEESAHTLSETSSIKQKWVIYPGKSDVGTRSTFNVSLATKVVGDWTLNAGLALDYTSKPSAGSKSTNSLLTFGFGYKF